MHSHHSHSGDYVEHAKDHLDDIVQEAIRRQFRVFCLTEHMPRLDYNHLYPEEIAQNDTVEILERKFDQYYHHAKRLQRELHEQINLLVGMEAEKIDDRYFGYVEKLRKKYDLDMIVGSIHHTNTIPIDYSQEKWLEARNSVSSTGDEVKDTIALFKVYFDDQYDMLKAMRPDVVGHFDLILLFCPDHLKDLITNEEVWDKVGRNIKLASAIGSLFEANSAAVRKGWKHPYPSNKIVQEVKSCGGEFCLSDDSHGIAQVGLNYHVAVDYLKNEGVGQVSFLHKPHPHSSVIRRSVSLSFLNEWVNRKRD